MKKKGSIKNYWNLAEYKKVKGKRKFAWFFALITFLITIASLIWFYLVFSSFSMFPSVWKTYLLVVSLVIVVLGLLLVFIPKIMVTGKILTGILNILLSIALIFCSLYLPTVKNKIEVLFEKVPTEGELEINFYVLTDAYKKENNLYQDSEETNSDSSTENGEETVVNIQDYKDKTFIVQKTMDAENQEYALKVLKRELSVSELNLLEVDSLWDAADALLSGQGDVMVLNSTYIPVLDDVESYKDFTEDIKIIYTVKKKLVISKDSTDSDMTKQPFSILIAGNDTWGETDTTGRTDVDIVATVNPTTKQIVFVSFPRDSYIPNPAVGYGNDKLTHMGMYGIQNTVDALVNYLGISINNYVEINFQSLVSIVDAIGGIDINNPYAFSAYTIEEWKGDFPGGNIHMDGVMTLAYVRERHSLVSGDFDRIAHQEIVMKALLEKVTTPAIITKIDSLLTSMQGLFKTNISVDSIYALCQMQLDDMATWNIVTYSLSGSTGRSVCASMGSQTKLSVVYLKDNQVSFVTQVINKVLSGEVINQGTLPN